MSATHRVTLTIVLDVEAPRIISAMALSVAHHRAESMAARVLLCGDTGGAIGVTDGPQVPGGLAVPVTATRATTVPGTTKIRALGKRKRAVKR